METFQFYRKTRKGLNWYCCELGMPIFLKTGYMKFRRKTLILIDKKALDQFKKTAVMTEFDFKNQFIIIIFFLKGEEGKSLLNKKCQNYIPIISKVRLTSLATFAQFLDPTTRQLISPPICLAAVIAWSVTGFSLSLLCSARISVLWHLYSWHAGELTWNINYLIGRSKPNWC